MYSVTTKEGQRIQVRSEGVIVHETEDTLWVSTEGHVEVIEKPIEWDKVGWRVEGWETLSDEQKAYYVSTFGVDILTGEASEAGGRDSSQEGREGEEAMTVFIPGLFSAALREAAEIRQVEVTRFPDSVTFDHPCLCYVLVIGVNGELVSVLLETLPQPGDYKRIAENMLAAYLDKPDMVTVRKL